MTRAEGGVYSVVMTNSQGEGKGDITVNVTDVPRVVQNLKPVRTTAKLIAVGWEDPADNGGEKIVEYIVDRQTVGSKDWQRVGKVFAGEELRAQSDTVEELELYVFRVSAVNKLGAGAFAETGEILCDDKYKKPSQLNAPVISEVNKSGCKITYEPPANDGGAPVSAYRIEYKMQGKRQWVEAGISATTEFVIAGDLQNRATYVFRVQAENEAGVSENGKECEPVVAKDFVAPPQAPTDLTAVDVTDTSVTLAWKHGEGLDLAVFDGYSITQINEGSTVEHKIVSGLKDACEYTIPKLATNSIATFKVVAVNDAGSQTSEAVATEKITVKQVKVKPTITSDDAGKTLTVAAGNALKFMATVTGNPAPKITLMQDGAEGFASSVKQVHSQLSIMFRNCSKKDSGNWTVKVANDSGEVSVNFSVVCLDVSDAPTDIVMGDMKDDMSVPLSWTEPANTGGHPILHYMVQQRDAYQDKFQTIADKVEGTRASATELAPGVTYFFRVIAVTELGRGDPAVSGLLSVIKKRTPTVIEEMPKRTKMDFSKPCELSMPMKPLTVRERRQAKFSVAFAGTPEPAVSWLKDGNPIKRNNKYSISTLFGVSTLIISNCRKRDAGMYQCQASNPTGEASCEASLAIMEV